LNQSQVLKQLLHSGKTLIVPDAYDGISARLIQQAGFQAIQCSGYSISISKSYKEEKFVSADENVSRTMEIVAAVKIPVMADGEDGYGQGDLFKSNLKRFLHTGIAGINIEDQNLWDNYNPNKIVPSNVMLDKIKAVLDLKKELAIPDFILNARTDALKSTDNREEGLKIAIDRANHYLQAGADLCFVPYARTKEEVKLLKREIQGPLSIAAGLPYNIREFNINDCKEIGIARVSIPSILILSILKTAFTAIQDIARTGTFDSIIKEEKLIDQAILSAILNK
jgi:2-methylisocitrate lyase-like PEP mutase family enzyme